MRKKYLIAGVVLALGLSMVGCGKDMGSTTADGTTGDVTTEAEVASDTDTEEATEEGVEEVSTWFSENNISFTEGEVSIPAYTYPTNDAIEMIQANGSYSEPIIEVSEPDSEGNVTYTVTYDITIPIEANVPASIAESEGANWNTQFDSYDFVDAYTGTVFPGAGMTDDGNSYSIDSVIEIDGQEYKINTSSNFEKGGIDDGNDNGWTASGDSYKLKTSSIYHITKVAVVPDGYNGLILALDSKGHTEYEEIDTEVEEAHPFDGNVSDYIFKDVSYGDSFYWDTNKACLVLQNSASPMSINVRVSSVEVFYPEDTCTIFNEEQIEEFEKNDGYVKIKLTDGTEMPVTGEVNYINTADGKSITDVFIRYDGKINYKQVQSVIVGNEEFTNGVFGIDSDYISE